MLTVKDKIEQFKRDCKSNDYYTKMIMDCNERIEELDHQLTGMGSIGNEGPKCENARNPYRENKLGLMLQQDKLLTERDEYIKRMNGVTTKLMKIIDPIDRNMIIDLLVHKSHYKDVVKKFHYNDYSALIKHIDRVLSKIV